MGFRRAFFVFAIGAVLLMAAALGVRTAGAMSSASEKRSERKSRMLEVEQRGASSALSSQQLAEAALLAPGDCGDMTVEAPETCDPPGIPAGAANECRDNCTFCGDGTLDATAELITNGDFELGSFTGWTVTNLAGSGSGSFVLDTPGTLAPTSGQPTSANPAGGAFYALTDMSGPGTHALSQSFKIPEAARSAVLTFQMFVDDWNSSGAVNPGGLNHNLIPNQHARVDLLAAGSGPFDTGATVINNFYLGVTPGALPHPWLNYSIDITGFTSPGVTYVLRFAGVENQFFLHVGVDNVKVTAFLETCDDGNNTNGDGCSSNCLLECGNGSVQALEECDDGNTSSGDGCNSLCMNEAITPISCGFVTTGASIVREGADVDRFILTTTPGTPVAIDVDAEPLGSPLDGMLGAFTSGEAVLAVSDDDPAPSESLSLDPYLLVTTPGDGILDIRMTAFEDLDFDGGPDHLSAGPYTLSVICNPLICGNGILQPPETCDPPGTPPGPGACRSDCTACGDGVLQAALEECDDNNNASNDGCSAACTAEFCGDRTIQPGLGETCEPSIASVALFKDIDPWGATATQDALIAHGIPFGLFSSADMGVVSLASYDKVVIASAQPPAFYSAVSANAAWFDAYVAGGGVLELHGATPFENDWSALPMPAGLTIAPQDANTASDAVTIVAQGNWLASVPNPIAQEQVDGWQLSSHSYFTGAGAPFTTVITEDEFQGPTLIELDSGAGCVIATMMNVEWIGADPDLLENMLLRDCASTCRDTCTRCGDGVVQGSLEQCDDGGTTDGDGCTAVCTLETNTCGDSVLDAGEQCDPPGPRPGGSTCCATHEPSGCSDPVCQDFVCALAPSCCTGPWDASCVALAESLPDCVSGCASTVQCTNTCCIDTDGDGTCDTADSCPLSPNPSGGTAHFDKTIHAIDSTTFAWSGARNVDWIFGNTASLLTYGIAGGVFTAAGVQTIAAPEIPPVDQALYWLIKPDCSPSSWSTGLAGECAEPGICLVGGRDGSLPMP